MQTGFQKLFFPCKMVCSVLYYKGEVLCFFTGQRPEFYMDGECLKMEKIRTTVRIAGHDYTLTSYDSEEHVQRVAKYVDRMINELNLATRLPSGQIAVLAAMSIADDMVKARDEVAKLKKEVAELNQKLDAAASGKAAE